MIVRGLFVALLILPAAPQETRTRADEAEVSRRVDGLLLEAWRRDGLLPAAMIDDAGFLRRLSLDLLGTIPTAAEVEAFLRDSDPDKRRRKIEEFLASPEHARYWAIVWEIRLIGRDSRRRLLQSYGKDPAAVWLEKAIAENRPYDAIVRDILTAQGVSDRDGEVMYVLRWSEAPANIAGQTTRLFLGIRLQCAQCHDHPYEKWKQEDFWGMAAYFARVRRTQVQAMDGRNQAFEVLEGRRGDVTNPASKKKAMPKYLEVDAEKMDDADNRRAALAARLTDRGNVQFARNLVNWMWAHFFGRGFVNPIDDFNETNKAVHPDVLELLTKDFLESGFDLRRLMRIIVNTGTYQLDSRLAPEASPDRVHFSTGAVRTLTPEQFFLSLWRAAGVGDVLKAQQKDPKAAAVNVDLILQQSLTQFVSRYENDEMTETLRFELTIPQVLQMMNGRYNVDVLPAKQGTLVRTLDRLKKPEERIAALHLSALSRPPAPAETERFLEYVRTHGDTQATWIDVFWVLLNSSEFFFNH